MIRRPPRSTQSRSSAASDVYKRQRLTRSRAAGRVKTSSWAGRMRVVRTCNRCPGGLTVRVNHLSRFGSLRVEADAQGLVSRAGTALVGELAARLGLPGALSGALAGLLRRRPVHEPGEVLCDLAAMLIDGGDCVSDLGALADLTEEIGLVGERAE